MDLKPGDLIRYTQVGGRVRLVVKLDRVELSNNGTRVLVGGNRRHAGDHEAVLNRITDSLRLTHPVEVLS